MKTIYADDMFLLNLIINYFIILSTAKLCALPLTRKRFALGAAVGALYSVLLLLPGFYPLALPPVKLLLGALITWLSFACRGRFLKLYIAFMAVSATFGGGVIAVSQPLLRSRFRLVPYSSVGIKQSLLPVFRPDELVINGNAEKNLLVGISPNTLSDFGDFSALI